MINKQYLIKNILDIDLLDYNQVVIDVPPCFVLFISYLCKIFYGVYFA